MTSTPEELRLRDVAIGSRSELSESVFQREKTELMNVELRLELTRLQDIIAMRGAEIIAIRQSHTWKIGSLVLAPLRWIKRSKR